MSIAHYVSFVFCAYVFMLLFYPAFSLRLLDSFKC